MLVVRLHRRGRDVEMASDPAELGALEHARLPLVPDEPAALEHGRGRMDNVGPLLDEVRVVVVVERDAVQMGRRESAAEPVREAEPLDGLVAVSDRAQNNLGVEVVGQLADQLGLDRLSLASAHARPEHQCKTLTNCAVRIERWNWSSEWLVMMMPSPKVSNWGLPARPSIWSTSCGLSSTHRPFSGL